MSVYPYIPGEPQPQEPQITGCADCGAPLIAGGLCPNLLCPSNTPTEPTMRSLMELDAELAYRPPDPHCLLCHGTGVQEPWPFCWGCG